MKILHIAAGNLFGGVEGMLITLARYQASCPSLEQEFAVCFEGRLSTELESLQAKLHRLGAVRASRPWSVLASRRTLRTLLSENHFDWLICHGAWPLGLFGSVAHPTGASLAFWMHDSARGKHWVERLVKHSRPDIAVCNSGHTAASLPALFQNVPHEVLYCPVPPPQPFQPGRRKVFREELGAKENEFVILIAARFEEWKGHHVLIDALSKLGDIPSWRAWIAGGAQRPHEAGYQASLQEKVAKNQQTSRISFLGQRKDVPDLMAAADLYCQPNTHPEPFGISLVEALYAGLPVVTSAMGGALEIITPECGSLLRPGDSAALADEIRALLTHKKSFRDASEQGPLRAAELCDPPRQLTRLNNLLKRSRIQSG